MHVRKRPRSPALTGTGPARPQRRAPSSVSMLDELVWTNIAQHLDIAALGRLRCVSAEGLLPPRVAAAAGRAALSNTDSLPPDDVTAAWDVSDWLFHAHLAAKHTACLGEEHELDAYVQRFAPSQYKWLRLKREAGFAWRCQGWIVSENLDGLRRDGTRVRSLDLSTLFFPPFPGFESCTQGLPVEHLRFSTGAEDDLPVESAPLRTLFEQTPKLQSFELVPKKHGTSSCYDRNFDLVTFCVEMTDALDSPYAPRLRHLHLDFSQTHGLPEPRQRGLRAMLDTAIAHRPDLRVHVSWPEAESR